MVTSVQLKCDLRSNRIKVFISSSMATRSDREQRAAIIAFFDRMPFYDLDAFENTAAPDPPRAHYLRMVSRADIVLVVLQGELREAVREEFLTAKMLRKPVFVFRHSQERRPELDRFIEEEVYPHCTAVDFSTTRELIDKIEESFLVHLLETYLDALKAGKSLLAVPAMEPASSVPMDHDMVRR